MRKIHKEQERLGLMPPPAVEPAATATVAPRQTDYDDQATNAEVAPSRSAEFEPTTGAPTASSPKVFPEAQSRNFLKTSLLLLAGAATGGIGCYLFLRHKSASTSTRH